MTRDKIIGQYLTDDARYSGGKEVPKEIKETLFLLKVLDFIYFQDPVNIGNFLYQKK